MVCFLFDYLDQINVYLLKTEAFNIHDNIPRFAEVAFLKRTISVLLVFCELRSIIYFI